MEPTRSLWAPPPIRSCAGGFLSKTPRMATRGSASNDMRDEQPWSRSKAKTSERSNTWAINCSAGGGMKNDGPRGDWWLPHPEFTEFLVFMVAMRVRYTAERSFNMCLLFQCDPSPLTPARALGRLFHSGQNLGPTLGPSLGPKLKTPARTLGQRLLIRHCWHQSQAF